MSKIFYRVEHSSEINPYLESYHNNCANKKDNDSIIGCGPWSVLSLFSLDELNIIAEISRNHAIPTKKEGFIFDEEIHNIVKPGLNDEFSIKQNFVFGCASQALINKYFPFRVKAILNNRGFHIGIYSSENVFTSQYQSVMDISKPFYYLGSQKLIA